MEDAQNVSPLPERLPDSVEVSQNPDLRMSPNLIRALKAQTGKTLDELLGESADEADRVQTIVWLQLRRQGFDAPWAEVGDVALEYVEEEPDPTSGEPSTSSPPSATSGA